jgi:betaine lipid synthase
MDWMDDDLIAAQLSELTPQMAAGGKLFWRSFGVTVHSPVLAQLAPSLVDTYDRVGWYLSQWVAEVPAAVALTKPTTGTSGGGGRGGEAAGAGFARFLCEGTGYAPINSLADDAYVCYQMLLHAMRTEKDVVAFYQAQGSRYDGFREFLLPGRDRLMRFALPWHESPRVWISVGCGTARDLEYVLGHVKACGTRVWLLDLSVDLLAVARIRVERLGLLGQVHLVVGDICKPETLSGLPPVGTADVITCSYCLTMIPQWRAALEAMMGYLRPGGHLALVDFTCRSDRPNDDWSQRLNRWWFAHDAVWLNGEHTATLQAMPGLQTLWLHESERRVVYTPLRATSYIFLGRKD